LPGVPDTWNELLYVSLLKYGKGAWKTWAYAAPTHWLHSIITVVGVFVFVSCLMFMSVSVLHRSELNSL
jgi:hypothetical protein